MAGEATANNSDAPRASRRLPWQTAAAALIALLAFGLSRRERVLPLVAGLALAISYLNQARLAKGAWAIRLIRTILYAAVALNVLSQPPVAQIEFARTAQWIDVLIQIAIVELALQFWQWPAWGGPRGVSVVLYSGLVFVAASQTFDQRFFKYLSPIYLVSLAIALRVSRPRATRQWLVPGAWYGGAILLLTMAAGSSTAAIVRSYRNELSHRSFSLSAALQSSAPLIGFSEMPALGAVQNAARTLTRVLRIEGPFTETHLRGMVYEKYSYGRWGPPPNLRHYKSIELDAFKTGAAVGEQKPFLRITRLTDDLPMLFAPLHHSGITLAEASEVQCEPAQQDALRLTAPAPLEYHVGLDPGTTPIDPALSRRQIALCLLVPTDIDERVGNLASTIASNEQPPEQRIEAVRKYLQSHHTYSLHADPGDGDPVSNFLLKKQSAHCEYFASAAVILLRCLKVPARYVTGFYAHEAAGSGVRIVREQDAHAWAEAWIEGTGWMTVETTPSAGLPATLAEKPLAWRRAWEWLSDMGSLALRKLSGLTVLEWCATTGATFLLAVLFMLRQYRLAARKRAPTPQGFEYTPPAEPLVALRANFELYLARRRIPCPKHLTWGEHLAMLAQSHEMSVENMGRFVREYTRIRFGEPDSKSAILELERHLSELQQNAK